MSQGNTFVEPCAVKFAYPRPVDYGQNNHMSPDGMMYFTAMGSSRADGPVSWMSADETHMARTNPSLGPLSVNNMSSYEFYAGEASNGDALWSRHFKDARPLFRWWNQTGITACTFLPKLQKMLCTIETTGIESGVNTQFDFDTYILEADAPGGVFPSGSKFKMVTYMRSFGPESYFVHVPSRFAPDAPSGVGYIGMAANFAEGIVPSSGGCGCSHCTVYGECQMGGIMHPTGGIYGLNLQQIRLCGAALNISCVTPPRTTLAAEAEWVPPTLDDFERAAWQAGHNLTGEPSTQRRRRDPQTHDTWASTTPTIYMGVDVDSNTPRAAPPHNFASCVATPADCTPSLLAEWAKLGDKPMSALPHIPGPACVGQLWAELIGSASFDTRVGFFTPPPNNTATPAPVCDAAGLATNSKCVRVLGFRGANCTTTVLLMINMDSHNTYVDKGDTGRDLYYLHRKQWQFTVPSLNSSEISLGGVPVRSGDLPYTTPLSLAANAAKAALSLPPLSLTIVEIGLVPAL